MSRKVANGHTPTHEAVLNRVRRPRAVAQGVSYRVRECGAAAAALLDVKRSSRRVDAADLECALAHLEIRSLQEQNRQLTVELTAAAHELRNLMLQIRVAMTVLDSGAEARHAFDSRGVIGEACSRAMEVVEHHLERFRDSGHDRRSLVDLADLVRQELVFQQGLQPAGGPALDLTLQPLQARVDPFLLKEAVGNLLANAFRHAPAGGTLRVALSECRGMALLEIEDQGPGLPPEQEERLFQPFCKSEASSGMGLGLWLARCAVEADGGQIGLENRPGTGCRFWIRVPLSAVAPPAASPR